MASAADLLLSVESIPLCSMPGVAGMPGAQRSDAGNRALLGVRVVWVGDTVASEE